MPLSGLRNPKGREDSKNAYGGGMTQDRFVFVYDFELEDRKEKSKKQKENERTESE